MRKFRDIELGCLILVILLLTGCFTQKKAERQLGHINFAYPELIASNCAALFPVVAKPGKPVITYIPADNTDYTGQVDSLANLLSRERVLYQNAIDAHKGDTSCQNTIRYLQARYDSLFTAFLDFKSEYVPCLPDTLKVTQVDTIPDLVAIAVRDARTKDLTADRDNWKTKAERRGKTILYLVIGLVLSVGWNFRKYIFRLPV